MKRILLPILMILTVGLFLISCDLFGDSDSSTDIPKKKYTLKEGREWTSSLSVGKENITKIVFDYTDTLPQNIKDNLHTSSTSIGLTDNDLIYSIVDGTELYVFSNGIICGNSDCNRMFCDFTSLTEISFNNFDTSEVTEMMYMFSKCKNLTSLDLSSFDTSNVTTMMHMFDYCEKLVSLNLRNFDTSKISNMNEMFSHCSNLTSLDISRFDTSNVTLMMRMFYLCEKLTTLDLSNFDTSKVTDMNFMFSECVNLTSLNISNFDINRPSVYTTDMFDFCGKRGTTVTINPTNKEEFDTLLSGWTYDGVNTYTKD